MRSGKLYSVGFVTMLVVLASATGVAFTTGSNANHGVDDGSNADLGGAHAQDYGMATDVSETEPNDDRANATPLPGDLSEARDVTGTINGTSDEDFFTFDAEAGQAVNLYYGGDTAQYYNIELYDPNGDPVTNVTAGAGDAYDGGAVLNETGTYVIRLYTPADSIAGDINYDFGVQTATPDAYEPNDDLENATPIGSGANLSATAFYGEQDFYAVNADAGDTIAATALLTAPKTDNPTNIGVDVLDANGNRINPETGDAGIGNTTDVSGAANDRDGQANATVGSAGTYYVRVHTVGRFTLSGGFAPYDLHVSTTSDAGQTTQSANTTAEPTQTTSGSSTDTATATPTPTTTAADTATATPTTTAANTVTATETATTETSVADNDTDSETNSSTTTASDQPTASVDFENQTSDGTTVTVDSVTLSDGGFVAIHNASLLDGNAAGSVVGVSKYLSPGTHEDVAVTLFDVDGQDFSDGMSLEENQTLIAMPHLDTNGNENYDFVASGGEADGPYTANGSAVVDPASITVENGTQTEDTSPAYYQVDFVQGDAIEQLRQPNYYTPDKLIRFAHGDTDQGVTRVSDGVFTTNDSLADRIDSRAITVNDNGTATVSFDVAAGAPVELTLASYQKTGPGWSPETEAQQRFVDADTRTFDSGSHTLLVDLPNAASIGANGSETGPTMENAAGANANGTLSADEILRHANQSYQNVSDVTAEYQGHSAITYRGKQYYERNASGQFTFKAPNQTRYDFSNGSIYADNGNKTTFYNASNNSATIDFDYYPRHDVVGGIDNQSYLGGYLDLVNQSNTVTYEGTTDLEGGEAYVFSLSPNYNFGAYYTESTTLYLDTDTYLPLGSDYVGTYGNVSNGTGYSFSTNTRYSDLRVNTGVSGDTFNVTLPNGTVVTDYSNFAYDYRDYDSVAAAQQHVNYTIPQPTDLPDGYSLVNVSVGSYPPTSYTAGSPVVNNSDVDLYYSNGNDTIDVYMYQLPENSVFYGFGKKTPINGQAAYFDSFGDGSGYLDFACGDLDYSIYGYLSRGQLASIGESVNCTPNPPATPTTNATG